MPTLVDAAFFSQITVSPLKRFLPTGKVTLDKFAVLSSFSVNDSGLQHFLPPIKEVATHTSFQLSYQIAAGNGLLLTIKNQLNSAKVPFP